MKITKQKVALSPPSFIPICFEIVLETAEEVTDWYRLTTNNISIPGALRSLARISAEEETRLAQFMSKLCDPEEKA